MSTLGIQEWTLKDKRALLCVDYFAAGINWTDRLDILNKYFDLANRPSRTLAAAQQVLSALEKAPLYLNVSIALSFVRRFI